MDYTSFNIINRIGLKKFPKTLLDVGLSKLEYDDIYKLLLSDITLK